MSERPIVLRAHEVRAILSGNQTQLRRLAKMHRVEAELARCPAHEIVLNGYFGSTATEREHQKRRGVLGHELTEVGVWADFSALALDHLTHEDSGLPSVKCPYGQSGDRLWVRETLQPSKSEPQLMAYSADDELVDLETMHWPASTENYKAIPAIHMPRWASRILLEITAVRVERLQGISEADSLAEGVKWMEEELAGGEMLGEYANTELFSILWSSIYGTDSYLANPWVWVVDFKLIEPVIEGKKELVFSTANQKTNTDEVTS